MRYAILVLGLWLLVAAYRFVRARQRTCPNCRGRLTRDWRRLVLHFAWPYHALKWTALVVVSIIATVRIIPLLDANRDPTPQDERLIRFVMRHGADEDTVGRLMDEKIDRADDDMERRMLRMRKDRLLALFAKYRPMGTTGPAPEIHDQ